MRYDQAIDVQKSFCKVCKVKVCQKCRVTQFVKKIAEKVAEEHALRMKILYYEKIMRRSEPQLVDLAA